MRTPRRNVMSATLIYLPMRKTIGVNEPARLALIFVLMLAACAAISPVRAQSYPARPIRLVIPSSSSAPIPISAKWPDTAPSHAVSGTISR